MDDAARKRLERMFGPIDWMRYAVRRNEPQSKEGPVDAMEVVERRRQLAFCPNCETAHDITRIACPGHMGSAKLAKLGVAAGSTPIGAVILQCGNKLYAIACDRCDSALLASLLHPQLNLEDVVGQIASYVYASEVDPLALA